MTTYKITPDSNTFSISLSRTGGQGAKGDSISSVYIDENNELVAEISNSAGDVIKTEQLGSIDTIVAQASTDAIGDLITTGNNYLINVAANDEGSYDFTVEAYQDGTIPSSLVQRTEDGYIRANAFKLEASNIEFHDVVKEGELGWSSERNAMIMGLTDDGKHTYVNQQQVAVVYNPYEALPQGTVVYVEGSYIGDSENFPTVAKASNNQVGTSTAVLGVVMYDIPAAEGPVFHKGYVCTHGIVEYVDTSAYVAGTRVWLGVDGNLVGVEPQTPAARTMIGYVVKQDAIEGSIYVQVQPGFELYELNDVRIYNPQDGDFIAWNASNSQWENINLNLTFASDAELQALNASIQASLANKSDNTHTHLLNDLSDVNISAKTTSFVITYDAVSQKWISRRLNVADITGLQTALDGKSNVGHTHTKSQITDFRDSDYATAAQGILANTAVQPGDNISDLVNDLNYVKNTDVVTQVTEAAVTAHENALTITEAQISDLKSYSLDTHTHDLGDLSNVHLGALSDRQLIAWNGIDAFANTSPDNLGLVEDTDIGVTVQGYTASLDSMANVPVTADKVLYTTGANTWSSMTVTPFARTLLNDLDAATMRTTIGAEPADATILKDADIGVNVQAYNSFLTGVNATFTNTLLSKLNSVEDGATADQTGAEIKALYENEANTNAFTDDEKTKLSNIEEGATADMTSAEIKAAYEANVDTNAFTDSEKSKLSGIESGATADQTGAEIKALYEAELNTNAFTDVEKSKLAGIESEATADQTGAEIKALYEGELDTNAYTDSEKSKLSGIEEGAQVNVVTSVNNHTGDIILETDDISDNLQNNKWFTQLERNKLSNIEDFADQTDFDSVSLSGAVMTSYTSVAGNGWVIDEDDMVSNLDTKVPTQQSVKAYVDARVASSVEYKGSYDAATNTPDLDLSPVGVTTGDMYTVTVAGNFFTIAVEVGDVLIAEVDDPSTAADWTIVNKDLDAASIKASYESNAVTSVTQATKLTTPRDITLSGVVAGTVSFDGTTDADIIVSSNFTLDDVTNVTETGKATGDYLRWTGTTWEGDTVSATDVSYSNVDSALESTTVKSALDELSSNKLNVSALNSTLTVYPTTASSTISGYVYGATSTTDTNYNTTAVDVSTGVINGQNQLISSIATEEGVLSGDTGVVVTSTIANVRRTAGTGTASFYYEVYHRTSAGVETLLAASTETDAADNASYTHYSATAIISGGTTFTATDRVVIKWYANQKTTSDPTYDIMFGGADPARTIVPVPISTLATLSTAASVSVDTASFTGYLAGTDANVQAALEQLDGISGSSTDVASTLVERDANSKFGITGVDWTKTHSLAGAEGRMRWNDTEGTVDLGLKGGNVTLQVGQEVVVRVFNNSGASIDNGKVVAMTGSVGGIPCIVLADSDIEQHGHVTIGVATETIADNTAGYVTLIGIVRDINTSAFSEGDELYVSQTAGVITNVKPTSVHVMHLGTALTINSTTGSIFVHAGQPIYDDLWRMEDVSIGTQAEGDILVWNDALSVWENKAQSTLVLTESQISDLQGYSLTSHNHTLDSLSNVSTAGVTTGQFLKWGGSSWVASDIPQINSLNDVGDVTISSVAAGQNIVYNNSTSKFENKTVTVSLTGDVTGSGIMNTDGDIEITTTTIYPSFNITGTTLTITNS